MTIYRHMRAALLATGLFLALAAQVAAQGAGINLGLDNHDTDAPVEITSEELSLDQENGLAVFTGSVIVRQGEITMTCDRMEVEYGGGEGGGNEIQTIRMSGGVTFVSNQESAEADSAVYSLVDETLVMTGQVLVTQGATALSSDRLTYDFASGAGVMEGNVKTVLQQAGNN